jgi:hypothetical protein
MMKNLQLPNNQLPHEQLTSHLGESGIKGRLRSCTRHGTIPEIKTKKDPESNIKHFILFCEKNTRKKEVTYYSQNPPIHKCSNKIG